MKPSKTLKPSLTYLTIPEYNNEAVEDVEAVADVLDQPVGGQLEQHLQREDDGEGQVGDLHYLIGEHVFVRM